MTIPRFLGASLALAFAYPAAAQTYPSQPIRMIAPFPPGGSVDITARLIAEPLGGQLGTRIIIDNRSGASGNIGMEAAARAAADGYTIVLNTIPLVTNQSLFDKLAWDPIRDFAPIGMVATSPHVLVVPNKTPASNVQELLRLARANPGKLTYASAGVGIFCIADSDSTSGEAPGSTSISRSAVAGSSRNVSSVSGMRTSGSTARRDCFTDASATRRQRSTRAPRISAATVPSVRFVTIG